MDISLFEMLLAVCIVAAGTAVQAALGFGLAMIAAPLLILLNRSFVPGPLIATALVLVLWMSFRERQAIDLRNFKLALLGRSLGTPPAAWLMGSISAATFDFLFAFLVILAVAISLVSCHPPFAVSAGPQAVACAALARRHSGPMSRASN
ncbi:MAG: TSUP family transporter, partial [Pseudomonadales bacterium]|nr:TSUP family transporter [Pseudomonadales bacterium]